MHRTKLLALLLPLLAVLPLAPPSFALEALPPPVGTLDSPATPGEGSGMPTTTAIYDRLASGAALPLPGSTFTEPVAGPVAATGRTLAEILDVLPVPDETNGATRAEVALGKTFWSLRPDNTWGARTGSSRALAPALLPAAGSQSSPLGNKAGPGAAAPQPIHPMVGKLSPYGIPDNGSGMPTTTAIYNRLVQGTGVPVRSVFEENAGTPPVPTGRTLAEIQGVLPVPDPTKGAVPAEVVGGKTFWGLRPDATWGPQVGSANCGSDTGIYNSPQFTDAELTMYSDVQYSVRPNEGGTEFTSDYTKKVELGTAELQLKLDVAVPPNATDLKPQPLVVWMHGGGLGAGDKQRNFSMLLTYARAGYVIAALNYRLTPKNKEDPALTLRAINHASEDLMNAIRFLKVNAATYHIDPTRIAIVGGSAGGLPVLINAVEYDTLAGAVSDFPGVSSQVAAAFTTGMTLIDEGFDPDTFVHYDSNDTPVLLFHAKPTDGRTFATWTHNVLPTRARINGSGNSCTVVAEPQFAHVIDWSLGGPYWGHTRAFLWKNLRLNEMP